MPDHYPVLPIRVERRARFTLVLGLVYEAFRSPYIKTIVVERLPCKLLVWDLSPKIFVGYSCSHKRRIDLSEESAPVSASRFHQLAVARSAFLLD